ncbi:putative arsenical pump-driving ATPase [Candidatus Vecturithrix granuli]|uniref:Putative arsenical pump-driving ATPase n=1 Tax=Vecturithrix granuli TaxID=1499967 RepID=A0A081BWG6_VECG1|nr:putative arsenical pump-driving ATPase [Candidatus Vecturithrix granuli]
MNTMNATQTQYLFFSGKGGVGKTTMACATAVHHAEQGLNTLIITTDPASNLADVFETEIGHKITPLGIPRLWGMEIDPDKATEEYRERVLGPMRVVMPDDIIKVLEEQFRSPCTTEIASFDRFVDFMVAEQSGAGMAYDVVIFDTAPTGHTIRLLELPVDWSKHIEESAKGSGNTCLGPVASIQDHKHKYDEATRLLGDPTRTTFLFVLQPDGTSLYETKRSSQELQTIGVKNIELIVNGVLPQDVCEHPFFATRYAMQQQYLARIKTVFPVPQRTMFLRDGEIKGIPALQHIARDLFSSNGNTPSYQLSNAFEVSEHEAEVPVAEPILELLHPDGQTKTIFFTGKGGVGKTTISCAAAFQLAARGYKTLLLTTDPASHIGEVLGQAVGDQIQPVAGIPNLFATIIDQEQAVKEYKRRILADAQAKYSEDMLIAIREELESPCTEEMAAFDKFMHYVESEAFEVVVFDTAPTGHTLRLLELPFDYGDQVSLMVTTTEESRAAKSETQQRFDRIITRLKDPRRSVFAFVVYPESTPVVEAYRAMLDLKDAGIPTQLVIANQVLAPEYCVNAYFTKRRTMQAKYLREIKQRFQMPMAIMPLLDTEIRGLDMVKQAAAQLFRSEAMPN